MIFVVNALKDHKYVQHLGRFYDCEVCVNHYKSEKALKTHIRTQHDSVGSAKCTEEGCQWSSKDPGQLHNHLLTEHQIGQPIKCQILNSDGVKCGKIFINTRSFTEHQFVHQEKNVECNLCNHLFATEEKMAIHVKCHHISGTQVKDFPCDECGSTFKTSNQLANHKTVHKLKQEAQGLYAELFSFVYFKCLSEFLLYIYKCSTSMAFT